MSVSDALQSLADRHGILRSFRDLSGVDRPTTPDTIKALLRANGLELDNDPMIVEAAEALRAAARAKRYPPEKICLTGRPVAIDLFETCVWRLEVEGEQRREGKAADRLVLEPLPAGLHHLELKTGDATEVITLIAAPATAPSIIDLTGQGKLWGITAALYGLQSVRNCGLGDYEDLARLAESTAKTGAGFLGLNPIHALGWNDQKTISPYSPTHRGFLNPMHIAADRIPGLQGSRKAAALISSRIAQKTSETFIDYAGFRAEFTGLLESLFEVFQSDATQAARSDFAGFQNTGGDQLADFTLFEALSERYGTDWRNWPPKLRSPAKARATGADRQIAFRMAFHAWLQWVAATQVSDAHSRAKASGSALGLYLDQAVGARRGGAEAWCESASIATGVSVGAPPDHLNPGGQNWDLAAYSPAKLQATDYRSFRQVLRATMRHAGMIRIDHVLGLNRSFWIPDDGTPGGYIGQPLQSLLALIAIEATDAQTAVIGEDLGLVPAGFRDMTRARGLYGYSVFQYEKDREGAFRNPNDLRAESLACFSTHDTPTVNGFGESRDIDWWVNLGWCMPDNERKARHTRQKDVDALMALGDKPDLFTNIHSALAGSPAKLLSIQLDDLTGQVEAQNLPGTIDEHPNWRRATTVPVDDIAKLPSLLATAKIMNDHGRNLTPVKTEETVQ